MPWFEAAAHTLLVVVAVPSASVAVPSASVAVPSAWAVQIAEVDLVELKCNKTTE